MTIYQNQVINPEKPWSFMDDTKDNILKDLAMHTLDPVFEKYGDFVYTPTWDKEELKEKYKGMTAISGNFYAISSCKDNLIKRTDTVFSKMKSILKTNLQFHQLITHSVCTCMKQKILIRLLGYLPN